MHTIVSNPIFVCLLVLCVLLSFILNLKFFRLQVGTSYLIHGSWYNLMPVLKTWPKFPAGFPTEFPTGFPTEFPAAFPELFPAEFDKAFPTEFPELHADWLAPHYPILNTKFPPIFALLNRATYHKSVKGSLPPCPKSHGNLKSMNKLTNEPAEKIKKDVKFWVHYKNLAEKFQTRHLWEYFILVFLLFNGTFSFLKNSGLLSSHPQHCHVKV